MTSALFGRLPFAEQIQLFRNKVNVPTAAWTDIWGNQHDRAFVVAGAARDDLLRDLRAAVDDAIANGTTLAKFRREFDSIVARTGWAYNGGRNWRTRVIYDTNLRTSYAAGREAQMADPDLRRRRPLGLYRHGGSLDPRPEHLRLDGTVVPLDHPWWDSWTPPNGWGCSCKKFAISERDARRMNLEILDDPPAWSLETETLTVGTRGPSPRTVEVPIGIDPGFNHRPGATTAGLPPGRRPPPDLPPPPPPTAGTPEIPDPPPAPTATSSGPRPQTLDEFLAAGQGWVDANLSADVNFDAPAQMQAIREAVQGGRPVRVDNGGKGASLAKAAGERYPRDWIDATDALGPLNVRFKQARAFQVTHTGPPGRYRIRGVGVMQLERNHGVLALYDIRTAVHELGHRIQAALPELDDIFQQLHRRRTAGEPLQRLSILTGDRRYDKNHEVARPDDYLTPYFGREYTDGGALELFSMTFERLLGDSTFSFMEFRKQDPELFALGVGLLLRWKR